MSKRGPDFDELVGTDLEGSERERLLRVHDLLVTAGPPPELRLGEARGNVEPVRLFSRRRRVAVLALAAALGVAVFAAGVLVGDRGDKPGTFVVVNMTGTAYTTGVRATLTIFDVDEAGNWPMELEVEGLVPSSGRPFELWLTKKGKLGALCGSFLAEADGTTTVPLNAPYKLKEYDGWVVVAEGSKSPLLTT